MNNKNRLLAIVAVSAFSLWASPAMAQDGFGGSSGWGPSPKPGPSPDDRKRREEEERIRRARAREISNNQVGVGCSIAGNIIGGGAGIAAGAGLSSTGVGAVGAGAAVLIVSSVVEPIVDESCRYIFETPPPTPQPR